MTITLKTTTEQRKLISTTVKDERGKRTSWANIQTPNEP